MRRVGDATFSRFQTSCLICLLDTPIAPWAGGCCWHGTTLSPGRTFVTAFLSDAPVVSEWPVLMSFTWGEGRNVEHQGVTADSSRQPFFCSELLFSFVCRI